MFDRLPNCKDFICKWEMQDAEGVCGLMGALCDYHKNPKDTTNTEGTCTACNNGKLEEYETGNEDKGSCFMCKKEWTCTKT